MISHRSTTFPMISIHGRLVNELKISFGQSPAIAEAIASTAQEIYKMESDLTDSGTTLYSCVHSSEPSGKPLVNCKRSSVKLTTWKLSDDKIRDIKLRKKIVLQRISQEAFDQEGVLTIEDCERLMLTDKRSIKRYISELRSSGISVPLRGYIHSTGRGQTHKSEIICFYLEGLNFEEIQIRTHHSIEAITRYILTFSRVIICYVKQKMDKSDLARVVNIGLQLVDQYLKIYHKYKEKNNERLALILDPVEINNYILPYKKNLVRK